MAKTPNLSYVADLSTRLLKAKAEVKKLQVEWDALFQIGDGAEDAYPVQMRGRRSDTKVSKIIDYLDAHYTQSFTSDEIHDALNLTNKQSTASTLSKLVKGLRLKKVDGDRYASLQFADDKARDMIPGEEP